MDTSGHLGAASLTVTPPESVELCIRVREGQPCLGVVYRPQPGVAYCYRCGGHEAGVVYDRRVAESGLPKEPAARHPRREAAARRSALPGVTSAGWLL